MMLQGFFLRSICDWSYLLFHSTKFILLTSGTQDILSHTNTNTQLAAPPLTVYMTVIHYQWYILFKSIDYPHELVLVKSQGLMHMALLQESSISHNFRIILTLRRKSYKGPSIHSCGTPQRRIKLQKPLKWLNNVSECFCMCPTVWIKDK